MKSEITKSNIFLFVTAIIWGFAFVAQRVGMEYVEPFTFNGIRFALGSISLIPIIIFFKIKNNNTAGSELKVALAGIISGVFLFLASSFQQVGLQGTTAGKAAFITGLYIVIVPILSIFLRKSIDINSWIGALLAVGGLYLLCVKSGMSISYSDFLELVSAVLFAVQILLIDYFADKVDSIKLAFYQFLTCTVLSFIVAIFMESIELRSIIQCSVPILYGGIMSVGVAYTFQILGQKNADPAYASIIMSMETVFAALGGFLILGEYMGVRQLIGCSLMFAGVVLSQRKIFKNKNIALNS
ncbi:MAG: DMT family transporter [Clostridium sp.]|uniref:DMT family transporter n=1 Tax=Clostridium sp. TaxID=1506 RepID=UPI0025BC4204|nr:DMT family transporter [Clostridium sp.]MCH3964974.1 DMT family transporter [Clostridium sp.]MCI1716532.1 DMT family transporter [Clostridium sp.]MCI1800986.1 DMT family transporter [Clostridium sp.]MCI1814709.1 DMT family transporter [Clostridium sp.]MCI1871733.1 DMT family transporter [Clostridium sp.]